MTLEPYKETSFTAFVELLNTLAEELGGAATDEAAQLAYESWLGRDLTQQRVGVRDPQDASRLLAYADYWTIPEKGEANLSFGVLEKAWGQGLEEKLLEWLLSQVKPLGVKKANMLVPSGAAALKSFLEKHHFEVAGAYRLLVLESLDKPEQVSLPKGYELTSYDDSGDDQAFITAMIESYSDLWGHGVATEAIWQEILEHSDPQTLYLLTYEGRPAGFVSVNTSTENGEKGSLDSPGLAPEHRNPNLYKTVALTGLQYLSNAGVKQASMKTWGEPEMAIQTYEVLGFEQSYVEIGYQYTLVG